MQSGSGSSMVHRRASVKQLDPGGPFFFCLCNMTLFRLYKRGGDRMSFIEHASDAAIAAIRPGVTAESLAEAANEVCRAPGCETGDRTGRSIGMSHLEAPESKAGDRTMMQPGMAFAVADGIPLDGRCGGRIGDCIMVTETGTGYLTDHPREHLYSGHLS